MKVFISWSGDRSKVVAAALRDWLPYVIQSVLPWMSDNDISAGARWGAELDRELADTHFGVLCLTKENVEKPWLHFEAGALSKLISHSRLVPYLLDLEGTAIRPPLAQFQGVNADEDGTFRLVKSINQSQPGPLPPDRLERLFHAFWPELEKIILAIEKPPAESVANARNEVDYLKEILELVRQLSRSGERTSTTTDLKSVTLLLRQAARKAEERVRSMEQYEQAGGGASTEIFWDKLVAEAEEERRRLQEALRVLE